MSRLLIANIIGGLGNQMFQYACGRACAERMGATLQLATDIIGDYAIPRPFELHNVFCISASICSSQTLKEVLSWRAYPLIRKLLARYRRLSRLDGNAVYEPHSLFLDGLGMRLSDANYLHGYWQSERYFGGQSDLIRQEFRFRNELDSVNAAIVREMRSAPSASVHIRRGDYLNVKASAVHGLCSEQYYHAAIALLKSRIPDIRLFVFSDDVDWVRQVLLPRYPEMVIVDHNRDEQSFNDMRLMSQCAHHIIANSSFSWWGAWLNPDPNKLVVAPTNWFANGTNSTDLIPDAWIRL